jgi:hypothetical protein
MWHVADDGRIEVRLLAQGQQAVKVARVKADRFIANVVSDLAATQDIEVRTNELRYSFSKTRPEVTVIWRAGVSPAQVAAVRTYLDRLNEQTDGGEMGEITDGTPDQ